MDKQTVINNLNQASPKNINELRRVLPPQATPSGSAMGAAGTDERELEYNVPGYGTVSAYKLTIVVKDTFPHEFEYVRAY